MEVNLKDKSYAFAMPCYDGKITVDTALSLMQAAGTLSTYGISYSLLLNASGSLIDAARNEIVDRFLTTTKDDVLVFIDSDVSFTFDGLARLLAESHQYPIVCGAYPTKEDDSKFLINYAGPKQNADGLIPIDSMGIGFTAVTREALVQMQPFLSKYQFKRNQALQYAYFRLLIEDEKYIGEDIFFFNKAREAGIQPMLDPYIDLGHVGTKRYDTHFKQVLGDE